MKLKVCVISDIHLGRGNSNDILNELYEKFIPVLNEDLDLLVIAGDYFDRVLRLNENASKIAFQLMDNIVSLSKTYNFKIRIIKGTKSHDFNQLDHFKKYDTGKDDFAIIENVVVEEFNLPNNEENINILYLPEEYVDSLDYYNDYFNVDFKYDLAFFHGTMDFAGYTKFIDNKSGAPTFNSKQLSNLVYGPIVGGHIHIADSSNNVYYTGSFSRTRFGEEQDKGFIVYEYDTNLKTYDLKFIKNDLAPTYVTVNLEDVYDKVGGSNLDEAINNINMLFEEYDHVRLNVDNKKGNENIINAFKEASNAVVEVKNDFVESYDSTYDFILNRELPLNETIKKYVKLTVDKDLSIDTINKIIKPEE